MFGITSVLNVHCKCSDTLANMLPLTGNTAFLQKVTIQHTIKVKLNLSNMLKLLISLFGEVILNPQSFPAMQALVPVPSPLCTQFDLTAMRSYLASCPTSISGGLKPTCQPSLSGNSLVTNIKIC